jgi:uncharacterized protein (DUF433 family)
METEPTLEQVKLELEQVKRELRAVREKYSQTPSDAAADIAASAEPQQVGTDAGKIIEYPTEHPHIYTNPEMHGGEPTIRGSGIMVRTIIERMRIGQHPLEIYRAFPYLNLAKIYDAISHYYDHTAEVDQYIRENEEAMWRLTHRVST